MGSGTLISQDSSLRDNHPDTHDDSSTKRRKPTSHNEGLNGKLVDSSNSEITSWRRVNISSVPTQPHASNGVKCRSSSEVSRKTFVTRESLLTDLLKISHIRSIYNVFNGILFILFIQQLLEEILLTGSVSLKLSYLTWAFGETPTTMTLVVFMNLSAIFIVYSGVYCWVKHRQRSPYITDGIALGSYIVHIFIFIYIPLQSLTKNQLPPASSVVVLCEQARLLMKTWAFVRENIRRSLWHKKNDDLKRIDVVPKFEQHIYFLFAPTLVYRDQYPRTASVEWSKVRVHFLHVFGCILFIHFLLTRFCPIFNPDGFLPFSKIKLLATSFSLAFPAFLILLCGFFLLLHSWMNAFAEMLQFGDRMFYKDWWNSTSFPGYYRTWNCIVHDWLYEYVYIEISQLQRNSTGVLQHFKFLPMMSVFFISSLVHEYILAFAFKFFYPVLLVMFGFFGMLLMCIRTRASFFNAFIWVSLILGTGILMCLYSLEWYARVNCPPTVEGFADYLIPRSWFCVL